MTFPSIQSVGNILPKLHILWLSNPILTKLSFINFFVLLDFFEQLLGEVDYYYSHLGEVPSYRRAVNSRCGVRTAELEPSNDGE